MPERKEFLITLFSVKRTKACRQTGPARPTAFISTNPAACQVPDYGKLPTGVAGPPNPQRASNVAVENVGIVLAADPRCGALTNAISVRNWVRSATPHS